ncbi:MAG TPA: alpha/beta fold hydrolase [Thermoanaerobaculia bacterium]|nr:alpha/beta fold hydrolase [Thermoanaerobaculia bacterium]
MGHLLPERPDPERKRLAVFVHGFGSSADCWSRLRELFRSDPTVSAGFDLACFEYPTRWFNLRFTRRIPTLKEIAGGLASFLETAALAPYREMVLVGHSQGGLVIQRYLVDKLSRGRSEDLHRLRSVVLIATPNLGSTLLSGPRKLISHLFDNPQERTLRVFDTEITEIRTVLTERVVGARQATMVDWPVPIQCIYGLEDGVVVEASARGACDEDCVVRVAGDHLTVLQPPDRDDARYRALAEALLDPYGHRCVFEVDLYDILVAVRPIPGGRLFELPLAGRTVRVRTDNVARVERSLRFSRRNRCRHMYRMRYGTRSDGYIRAEISHPNEAPPQEQQVYEDQGTSITFGFRPMKGETYRLDVEVFKGFDPGHRDAHFHLAPPDDRAYFKAVRVRLDLSAYLGAGWRSTKPPRLYHHPRDEGHSQLCEGRRFGTSVPATADGGGRWSWELANLRGGVLDLVWDVDEPLPAEHGEEVEAITRAVDAMEL